jgi:hypothetical protein
MRAKLGMRTVRPWTPKRAHTFAMKRVSQIELLLQEIAVAYSEVDSYIETRCDDLRDTELTALKTSLDEALAEGRSL